MAVSCIGTCVPERIPRWTPCRAPRILSPMGYRNSVKSQLYSTSQLRLQSEHLRLLRGRVRALRRYRDFEALLGVLRNPDGRYDQKDAVLLGLVEENQRSAGGPALSMLSVLMFPALDNIYYRRRWWSQDPDDVWAQVFGAFVKALERYPVARRRAKVAANIRGETIGELSKERARERRVEAAVRELGAVAEFGNDPELYAVRRRFHRVPQRGVTPATQRGSVPQPRQGSRSRTQTPRSVVGRS